MLVTIGSYKVKDGKQHCKSPTLMSLFRIYPQESHAITVGTQRQNKQQLYGIIGGNTALW